MVILNHIWLVVLLMIFAIPCLFWGLLGISALFVKDMALGIATVIMIFGVIYIAGLRILGL